MPRFSCKSPTVSAPFYNSEEEEQTLKKEEAQRAIKKNISSFQLIEWLVQ